MKEIECLNELRENNQKKRLDSSSTFCICEKPYSDLMLQCDLCNEYYHRMLINFNFLKKKNFFLKVIVYLIMDPMLIHLYGGYVIFVLDHEDHVFKMLLNFLQIYKN